MRIGISSWSCPWAIGVPGYPAPDRPMDAKGLLKLAQLVNAAVLQIADNLPLHAMDAGELTALAHEARQSGIGLEAGTCGLDPKNLMLYLGIAKSAGASLVRTLPHNGSDRPDLEEAARRLGLVKRQYEEAGVTLAIENHDFYPCFWLKQLVERLDSPCIGVCLDAVNGLGQGESFREVLECLGPYTVNFHCKDFVIVRKPSNLGFDVIGAPAGEGMLDLNAAYSKLPGGISWVIESWLPWQGSLAQTLQAEKSWLEKGARNLKQVGSGRV
jgi:3-oxoisoapionate decarboxylase